MNQKSEREYATQADYAEWVREPAKARSVNVIASLRKAFSDVIHKEEVEIVVFSGLTVGELADKLMSYRLILKPLLVASNLAARAIERDLGIKNLDTYDVRLSREQAFSIAGYIKPFLPESLPLPTLAELDRVMFADKEIRKIKGQWEKMVTRSLNSYANVVFTKSKFQHNDQIFELDAAARDASGDIIHAVDIKRIEARRDIHKRTDEIVNKGAHFKAAYPQANFGVIIYYPFVTEHANVHDRLQSPYIDSIVFAGVSSESISNAVKLLLGKFQCLRSSLL
jgi:hypothetical protein